MTSGIITHIQRFSVHDGPGIRTTVFLKGCQMHCPWCHNPETRSPRPELQVFASRCIDCAACADRCARGGHEFAAGQHVFHRERCVGCGRCAEVCFAQSLVRVGETRTAEEVLKEVLMDRPFYQPAGGVTLSGGEPLAQPDFTRAILELCRREGVHTAIESNLAWPWLIVAPLVDLVDLFMVDIKIMDEWEHQDLTGVSNRQTLRNLCQLDAMGKPLVVRTPVIAGVNDRPEQIAAIADWLAELSNVRQYDLLPYHPLGTGKYEALGLTGPADYRAPSAEHLTRLAALATRPNLVVKVAGASGACATDGGAVAGAPISDQNTSS